LVRTGICPSGSRESGLVVRDVGGRQRIVSQKNVVSAAKLRSDYLRRMEEAATEES